MAGMSRDWDDIDTHLLDLLQADADRTLRDLGDEVGLSPSAVQRRIARYKASGLMRTVGVVEPRSAASLVRALVLLTLAEESVEHHRALGERLRARPEVQQCYGVSGRWDYAVVLSAANVDACRELGDELFKADPNIRRYDTLFVFDAVKTGASIPADILLAGVADPARRRPS
jgi:Lrp/AsnC family transcriptional regulator, leucine-responsive regulatory protein